MPLSTCFEFDLHFDGFSWVLKQQDFFGFRAKPETFGFFRRGASRSLVRLSGAERRRSRADA
jgi:hypothetical protein